MSFAKSLALLFLAAAPVALLSAPAIAAPASGPTTVTTQLPRGVVPSHYAIAIVPDAQNLRFTGTVAIDLAITVATDSITLNAADMTFGAVSIAPVKMSGAIGTGLIGKTSVNADAQTATFTFAKPLAPGQYTLSIAYNGIISTQASGLFALDYKVGAGQQKRALFTQFEAPDARRFVPSWDEPSYKATFALTATVPSDQLAVGNMPVKVKKDLGNGLTQVTFATSPKMSSYLLFFGMGELDRATKRVGNTEVGVIVGRGNTPKAQLALDASAAILPYYNEYFGVPFPLPKLDNVAGPGQSQFFSAMENWGAIFTFERSFLVDPTLTSETQKRRIYETVAHEMAHQWFGDLVTMAWWDDLWLNEGFASWMATKVTDTLQPDWQMLLTRVDGREQAMGLDAFRTTHPVVQRVNTVDQVNQAFDAITYQKGEAVITMLEAFAGEDVWRTGIRAYMKAHAYGNTQTDDLWQAVEGAGAKGLVTIAHDYTSQPGIPLVRVESAQCSGGNTQLTLSQGEFSRDAKGKAPLNWHVPLIAQAAGTSGAGAVQRLVLDRKGALTLPGCGAYVVNAGQAGYYRTLYPAANVAALAKGFAGLSAIDQLGLLADNWELSQAGYQPIGLALDLVAAVPANASPTVLNAVPTYLKKANALLEGDKTAQEKTVAYASRTLGPWLATVGYEARPGENPQIPVLRQNLVETLGALGDPTVVSEAGRRFAALARDPKALDGPLKTVWLGIIATNADQAIWDRLRTMANAAPTALEREQYFTLLGRANNDALAVKALELAATAEPGATTSAGIISAVGTGHSMMAVDWALAHRQRYEALVDSSARSQAVSRLGSSSADPEMAKKLDAYATQYLTPESRKATDRVIAAITARAEARARLKPDVIAWFARKR